MRTQQLDVYEAEAVLGKGHRFESIKEMQDHVDSLVDSWWWTAFYSKVERVIIHQSDGPTSFAMIASVPSVNPIKQIAMFPPQWHMRTLSHELAHVFAHALHTSGSHDPWFARERLVTTYCMMGSDAYSELWSSFIRHGIEVAAPNGFTDNIIPL
jgi:hypothetical protein